MKKEKIKKPIEQRIAEMFNLESKKIRVVRSVVYSAEERRKAAGKW